MHYAHRGAGSLSPQDRVKLAKSRMGDEKHGLPRYIDEPAPQGQWLQQVFSSEPDKLINHYNNTVNIACRGLSVRRLQINNYRTDK